MTRFNAVVVLLLLTSPALSPGRDLGQATPAGTEEAVKAMSPRARSLRQSVETLVSEVWANERAIETRLRIPARDANETVAREDYLKMRRRHLERIRAFLIQERAKERRLHLSPRQPDDP